jgi:hypothetical protein
MLVVVFFLAWVRRHYLCGLYICSSILRKCIWELLDDQMYTTMSNGYAWKGVITFFSNEGLKPNPYFVLDVIEFKYNMVCSYKMFCCKHCIIFLTKYPILCLHRWRTSFWNRWKCSTTWRRSGIGWLISTSQERSSNSWGQAKSSKSYTKHVFIQYLNLFINFVYIIRIFIQII